MSKFGNSVAFGLIALAAIGCNNETGLAAVDGEISVSPPLWDETVVVGEATTADFTLTHVEGQNVAIVNITVTNIDGDYFSFDFANHQWPEGTEFVEEATPPRPIVKSNSQLALQVPYVPTEEGYHRAEILIETNGLDTQLTVNARAHAVTGAASVRPLLLDFGAVDQGESRTVDLTVENDGAVDLEIVGGTFSSSAFVIDGTTPIPLLAGDEVQVPVKFTAADDQPVSATLDLDLGGFVTVNRVTLRANDCENGTPSAYDVDLDGYTSCGGDCDDDDPDVHPGGIETYDSADEDCDGTVDEGTEGYDDDGDGMTELDGDCNDGDVGVYDGAAEDYSNGVDDDCDGVVDYGTTDADSDGYSEAGGDCDDVDGATYPGAPELEDGIDNDCDGVIDEGTTLYDDDGDGMTEAAGDCDDGDASIYTGATETADWTDEDCDGTVDEGTTNYDDDVDGFSELGGDCDDDDDTVNPGEPEDLSTSTIDENCNGRYTD